LRSLPVLAFFVLTLAVIDAQQERLPSARLVEAPRLVMPGAIDSNVPSDQGVAVGRLAWADRDAPVGRVSIWREGAWLPPRQATDLAAWEYPSGTPLSPPLRPWHDGQATADAFWGPSVHWNRYLERYVMLLNRARDESFNNEGIYVSYARTLNDPRAWSAPRKIMNGGGWYPQVAGLEPAVGSDKDADRRARFFLTGRSERFIEFQK
jgi:hypothetical protein